MLVVFLRKESLAVATCSAPSRKESESSLPGIPKGQKTGQGIDKRTPPLSTTTQRQEGLGGRAFGEGWVRLVWNSDQKKEVAIADLKKRPRRWCTPSGRCPAAIGAASELRFFLPAKY
jgi:hypothetical protein